MAIENGRYAHEDNSMPPRAQVERPWLNDRATSISGAPTEAASTFDSAPPRAREYEWRVGQRSSFLRCGPVAQLGARFHGMEEVAGSIPARSTKFINNSATVYFRDDPICVTVERVPAGREGRRFDPGQVHQTHELMYTVYILRSKTTHKFYIGCTSRLSERLEERQRGQTLSTRGRYLRGSLLRITGRLHLKTNSKLSACTSASRCSSTEVEAFALGWCAWS